MQDIKVFNTQDLVLKVNPNFDPSKLKLSDWNYFIEVLCGDRDYQKIAIKTLIIYMASGLYNSIEDLIQENYTKNVELRERYKDLKEYNKNIQLPNKLSATVDLATGTGKSYVMYGIAQIALGIGLVDKVLILCPSLTIERELTKKFLGLSSDSKIKNCLPINSKIANPRIIDATQTIKTGDICIENIHAVYSKNSSSIQDSLGYGKGERCLVLSDEVHHTYNKANGSTDEDRSIKKWKSFLLDSSYNFRYILGVTGTAYVENEYFNDVVFRYSLRQAIEDRITKTVFYVSKDDGETSTNIKFQKIWQNHDENKKKYNLLKPLTILITNNIQNAKQLFRDIYEFLAEKELGINLNETFNFTEIQSVELARLKSKIMIVTSDKEHKHNFTKLADVDSSSDSTEWIISVSMLTEGWDVKNVFQIVPMDERAFNSKLLISQVLGRGLRVPINYPQSQVIVFNHDSWNKKIKSLVDEILEIEMKIVSSPVELTSRSSFHFDIHNINYEKDFEEIISAETKVFDYTKDYIEFAAQVEHYESITSLVNINGEQKERIYSIEKEMFSVESIVNKIYEEFKVREWEGITLKLKDGEYTKNSLPPKEVLLRIIRNSMDRREISGDFLDKRNRQAVFSSFNTLLRKRPKSIVSKRVASKPFVTNTTDRQYETVALGNLRRDTSVFYTNDFNDEIVNEDTKELLKDIISEREFRGALIEINKFLFKTPFDIVFTSSTPEEKFIQLLCKDNNAASISSWMKSKNQSFYSIDYSITKDAGKRTTQAKFNPDFFIKIDKDDKQYIIVVEIKADGDDSDENKAKFKYGKLHFSALNKELENLGIDQRYIFHFLSPQSYNEFFTYLNDGRLLSGAFLSELETKLT